MVSAKRAIAGAEIALEALTASSSGGVALRRTRSDPSGRYRLEPVAPGRYRVVARAPGFLPVGQPVRVSGRRRTLPPLVLRAAALGRVRVAGLDGRPIAGAELRLVPRGGSGPAHRYRTGPDGRVLIHDLPAGRYRIGARARGRVPVVGRGVRLPARALRLQLVRAYTLEGRVVGQGSAVRAIVRAAGLLLGGQRSVAVSADGRFSFDELPAGQIELQAATRSAPWRASAVRRLRVGPSKAERVALRLVPALALRGKVVRKEDGAGVAGAQLLLRGGGEQLVRRASSDAAGRFAIGGVVPGAYLLDARAEQLLPRFGLAVRATAGASPIAVRLDRGRSVSGRVRDTAGKPIAGARVFASIGAVGARVAAAADSAIGRTAGRPVGELGVVPGPVPPIPADGQPIAPGAGAAGAGSTTTTGHDGRFTLHGLPRGQVEVHVVDSRYRVQRVKTSTAEADAKPLEIVLQRAASISGQVRDERGLPVSGAQVVARSTTRRDVVETGDSGSFVVDGLDAAIQLTVSCAGFFDEKLRLSLSPGEKRAVEVKLHAAEGALRGRVVDGRRAPVAGAQITARVNGRTVRARSDAHGVFRLAGIGHDQAALEVTRSGFVTAHTRAAARARSVEIELARLGRLRGRVSDWRTGAAVEAFGVFVREGGSWRRRRFADRRGQFALPLAPGSHRVRVRARGYARRELLIRVSDPRRGRGRIWSFELHRSGSIYGRVLTAQRRPVVGAVVSTSGISARTDDRGRFALTGVPAGNRVVIVKLADGRALRSDPTVVRAGERTGPLRFDLGAARTR